MASAALLLPLEMRRMVMNNPRTRLLKLVMQLRLIWHFFDLKRIHVDTLWHNQISYILQHSKNKINICPDIHILSKPCPKSNFAVAIYESAI